MAKNGGGDTKVLKMLSEGIFLTNKEQCAMNVSFFRILLKLSKCLVNDETLAGVKFFLSKILNSRETFSPFCFVKQMSMKSLCLRKWKFFIFVWINLGRKDYPDINPPLFDSNFLLWWTWESQRERS